MNRLVKQWVLWILFAALPMQGMAAVTKILCNPLHHGSISKVMQSQLIAHNSYAMHHAVDHSGIHHDAGVQTHAQDTLDDAPVKGKSKSAASVCSQCAACFIGAAAPPPVALSAPMDHSPESVAILLPVFFPSFIPAGPERPPRA